MPRRRRAGATAVIDTSCLLNLLHLNLVSKIAQQHSLNVKSTLELLRDFKLMGVIPKMEPLIAHLRSAGRGFWLSGSVVERALEDVDEC